MVKFYGAIFLGAAIVASAGRPAAGAEPAGAPDIDFLQMLSQPPGKALPELRAWQEHYDGKAAGDAFDALTSFLERADKLDTGKGDGLAEAAGERREYEQCIRLIADAFYAAPSPELQATVEKALVDQKPLWRQAGLIAAAAVADGAAVRKRLLELASRDSSPEERGEAVLALLALGESRDRTALEACRERAKAADPAIRDAAAVAAHRLAVACGEQPTPPIDLTAQIPTTIQLGLNLGAAYNLPQAKPGDTNATVLACQFGSSDPFTAEGLAALSGVLRAGGTALVANPDVREWPKSLVQWAKENQVALPEGGAPANSAGIVNFRDYRSFCDFPYLLADEQGMAAKNAWTHWAASLAAPILTMDSAGALALVQENVLGRGRIVFTTINLAEKRIYQENFLRWIYGDALLARPAAYLQPRYGMDPARTTPHRPWALEWAAGKPKVLWISDESFKRGLIEVRERLGMDWRFVPYDAIPASTTAWPKKGDIGPSVMGQRAAALVEESLPSTEALVLDPGRVNLLWGQTLTQERASIMGLDTFPSHLRRRLARRIREGMGLLVLAGNSTAAKNPADPGAGEALAAFIGPMLPFATNNLVGTAIRADQTGKGRRAWLDLNWPHLAALASVQGCADIPAELRAPGVLSELALINPDEYRYALLAKCILWAAGKSAGPAIRALAVRDGGAGQPATLEVTLSEAFKGRLECTLRNRYDETIVMQPVPVAGTSVSAPLPAALLDSAYIVEAVLKDPAGLPVNFAATWARIALPVAITNLAADRPFYRDGETARLTADLSAGIEGEATIEVRDTYGRKVFAAAQPLAAGQRRLEFSFPVAQPLTRLWDVEVTLRRGGAVVTHARRPIGIARPAPPLDYDVESDMPAAPLMAVFKDLLAVNRIIGDPETGMRYNFDFDAGSWWLQIGGDTSAGVTPKPNERVPCLSDPAFRLRVIRDLKDHGPLLASLGVTSYMIGDEVGIGPACLCAHSMYQFRRWLKDQYADLAALNKEWGSTFASWNDVLPLQGTNPERPGSHADYRRFQMWEFSEYCSFMEMVGGDTMPGFTAGQSGGVSGNTMLELSGLLYYYGVIERVPAVIRRKDAVIGSWYSPGYSFREDHEATCRHWPWWHLFRGTTRMCLWYTAPGGSPGIHGDLRPYAAFLWLGEEMRELHGSGLGRLLRNARRDEGRCAVYESERNAFVQQAVKKLGGPDPASSGDPAPAFLKQLIESRAISEYQVERGAIASRGLKLLCMPAVVSLSERERTVLRAFVRAGGVLVADTTVGLRNEHGTWVGDGFARELFGVSIGEGTVHPAASNVTFVAESADAPLPALRRLGTFEAVQVGREVKVTDGTALARAADNSPALVVKKTGPGVCVFLNFPFPKAGQATNALAQALAGDLATLARVEPSLKLDAGTNVLPSVDFGVFRDGDAFYAGLVAAGSGGMIAKEKTVDVRVTFPEKRQLYDSRKGANLGEVQTVTLALTPGVAKLYAGLPAKITGLQVTPSQPRYKPGDTLEVRMATLADAAVTWKQCLSVRVTKPDGTDEPAYTRTVLAESGQAVVRLPLALDAAAGNWTVEVSDAATGVKGRCQIGVQP